MTISLRSAGFGDAARLLAWRNDPATRRASFATAAVDAAGHAAWLRARLADPATLLLIAEDADGTAVGQVRLDRDRARDAGEVSIAVAPQARGRGIARAALAALAARDDLGVATLRARVKADNAPSLALFAAAGYAETRREADGTVVLERAVVSAA
jgi:RimJ/RimL family protein N-acetyltransferase